MILFLFGRYFFFFKQKTAYELRISDWSSDVCSSDLSGMTPAFGNHHTQSCAARRIGRATQKGNIVRRQPQYDSLGITSQLCKAWRMKASAPSLRVVSAQPQYGSTRQIGRAHV